jgi:hypothetical protein
MPQRKRGRVEHDSEESSQGAIVVTGMHRTGTSMIAKILRLGGLWLGRDEDMIDPAPDNPEGFFEHARVVRLNDELLEATGGAWDHPPSTGPLAADDPRVRGLHERALDIIADLSATRPWGWKDPRTALTAPFWLDVLPEPRFVICVRHPVEVAISLKRRNQISYLLALTLWERYYTAILDAVAPEQRLVTHYGVHFHEGGAEVGRLLNFAGLPSQNASSARSGLDEGLRHHQIGISLAEAGVSTRTIELYQSLCGEAGWVPESGTATPVSSTTVHRAVVDLEVKKDLTDKQERHIEWLEGQLRLLEEERDALLESKKRATVQEGTVQSLVHQVRKLEDERAQLLERLSSVDLEPTQTALAGVEKRLEAVEEVVHDALYRLDARSPADVAMVGACREVVRAHVPLDAPVLVVGKGDPTLANLYGRPTTNFPQDRDGRYPGFALADDVAAIAHLEALRAKGARFLLVPSASRWWLDRYPSFGEHVLNRYRVVAHDPSFGLLADVRSRRSPASGWPLAVSDTIDRLVRATGRTLAVLDWTDLEMSDHLPRHNVFSPASSDGILPYLDTSIDVVLLEENHRLAEARRVGGVAVIMLRRTEGGNPEVASVELVSRHTPCLEAPMTVVVTSTAPDSQWLTLLGEALAEEPDCRLVTRSEADLGEAEVVALVDEGVLPLPGCFLAARTALRREEGVSAVAVKLLSGEGSLEAAGVTVFAEGSYAGVAAGSFDVAAPWHEYVRETCWGPGLMLFRGSALREIDREAWPGVAHASWAAQLWARGSRVVYQPAAAAVRGLTATPTDVDAAIQAWHTAPFRPGPRPERLDDEAWREILVTEDLRGSP